MQTPLSQAVLDLNALSGFLDRWSFARAQIRREPIVRRKRSERDNDVDAALDEELLGA